MMYILFLMHSSTWKIILYRKSFPVPTEDAVTMNWSFTSTVKFKFLLMSAYAIGAVLFHASKTLLLRQKP